MARWEQDSVDFACESWAYQWASMYARSPRKASEYVGRLSCTLGLVRIMGDGAASGGSFQQVFPEGFLGDGLVVACAMKTMTERQREWMYIHYVYRWFYLKEIAGELEPVRRGRPLKQIIATEEMHINLARYFQIRDAAKRIIRDALTPLESKLSA
jgi:hypothetical protein